MGKHDNLKLYDVLIENTRIKAYIFSKINIKNKSKLIQSIIKKLKNITDHIVFNKIKINIKYQNIIHSEISKIL